MENRILPELGGEVREITALFADLRNYTRMSEKLTPTEMIEMLHTCLNIASIAIAEFGGVIVNFMGDAVMAIFNAPDEQTDHAQRAVRAALNLQSLMNRHHQQTTVDKKPILYFGIGINTGSALVGNIGAQWHYQYTAVGDTVNVASRICSHAQPQEILIGENTYAHLQRRITAQALPPIQFKGKSEASTVYRVLAINGE
jgi:adenylate cyclase